MSNYKILTEKADGFRDGRTTKLVVILVTSESDIPQDIPAEWEPGSLCVIANSHTFKWLTKERAWK